jgi:hypothetical protein
MRYRRARFTSLALTLQRELTGQDLLKSYFSLVAAERSVYLINHCDAGEAKTISLMHP